MVKTADTNEWEYRLLALDVKGLFSSILSIYVLGVLTYVQAIHALFSRSAMIPRLTGR
jgi:hypothetical protein